MKKAAPAAAIIIIIVFIMSIMPVTSFASGFVNYEKAVDLKILGLLNGSGKGFDLERTPTRVEGAVMLIRLLGKEKSAVQSGYSHPFSDVPTWADAYIGYMYHFNLTAGMGNGNFGSGEPLSALQYTTFVLRSLGYDDRNNDFKLPEALDKAQQIGLLSTASASSLGTKKTFIRDDMVGISYNALNVKLKSSTKTLLDKLVVDDKAVYKPAATVLGLYTSDMKTEIGNIDSYIPASTSYGYTAKNSNDLFLIMRRFLYLNQKQFKVDTRNYSGDVLNDFKTVYGRAYAAVSKATGVEDFVSSWKYDSVSDSLSVTMGYRFAKSDFDLKRDKYRETINKARQLVSSLIGKDMPAFDKEKLLHDYIVNNTRYDIKNYTSGSLPEDTFTAYGCLVKGLAVCEGYSKAMKLLCDLSAIDCLVVNGKANDSGSWEGHAWNLVKIDNDWYHLDVTYDDPVMKNGESMLTYHYFNLTDNDLAASNSWDKSAYPICNSTKNGYYYRNNMVAASREEFTRVVKKAVDQQKSQIEVKINGYSDNEYSDLSKIMFSTGTVQKYKYLVNEEFGIIRIYGIQYS